MDKILEVKDLKISFRTANGTVKAVRDISFDLEKGKTLAIVGESGSGKSVTSKAILGILAGNSIVDSGEIIYDGRDLLKITEEEMCTIRGDKISMIFQDPLSSLNPIVKIGKQITEAMLLKNKTSRKQARKEFNSLLKTLKTEMIAATGEEEKVEQMCETFDNFCIEANKLEQNYNAAYSAAGELIESIEDVRFRLSKNQKMDVKTILRGYAKHIRNLGDPYLTNAYEAKLSKQADILNKEASRYKSKEGGLTDRLENALNDTKALLEEVTSQTRPEFFRIGYYSMNNPNEELSRIPVDELNEKCLEYLDENFMVEFIAMVEKGVERSFNNALEKKKAVVAELEKAKTYYSGKYERNHALKYAMELSDMVEESIDRLETNKDSVAYTFRTGIDAALNKYFYYKKKNPQEEARFARQTKKREALIKRGKNVDWKVIPKNVADLDELRESVLNTIDTLDRRYESYISVAGEIDFHARSIAIIDYFKEKASKVVYKVTRSMAKAKAIKLMEEVGIAEPRMRYYQYPFEFSGGMRQRIVIAIALSADPEILICDEPTTALDVTIQAQILELINNLKEQRNLSVIFITHDLGVVANMADDIAVMYAGKIVEYGTAEEVFYDPRHPYTWALLSSMPDLDTKEKLDAIPGTPPNMIYPPEGDAFAERNKYAMQIDFEQQPPMFEVSKTHKAATWLLHPDAPKVEIPKIITDRIARMKQKAGGAENV